MVVRRVAALTCVLAVAALVTLAALAFRWWATPKLSSSQLLKWTRRSAEVGFGSGSSPKRGGCPALGGKMNATREPLVTTLCQVIQQPGAFACKRIQLRASVLADCMHGTVLVDRGCDRGIALWAAEGFEDHADITGLESALCDPGPAGTIDRDRKIVATFTGRFLWRSDLQRGSRALEAEHIEHMTITPTADRN
jgi:hypothetical protein